MPDHAVHAERVSDLLARLDEAGSRLATRLEGAGATGNEATSGWSAAQVGVHVALVNSEFAAVIDGSAPVATPPPDGFVERPWSEIASGIPQHVEAPARLAPPADVSVEAAAALVRQSTSRLRTAIGALSPERARYCYTGRLVGTISLYQMGEWAAAHMIRHNQQAKRILGG